MKTRLTNLILIIGLVALALWFYYLHTEQERWEKEQREYWEKIDFKTDTVIYKVQYDLPKMDFKFLVPPQKVILYPSTPTPHISVSLNDSLITVIDSLKREITSINTRYLTLYPLAPKLIYGEFHADSLSLDLLSIDGNIRTHKYGLNYNRFAYQWKDGGLKADPIKTRSRTPFDLYGYGGYDFLTKDPLLGLDAAFYKQHWRLKGNTFITIDKEPELNLQLTLGRQIK